MTSKFMLPERSLTMFLYSVAQGVREIDTWKSIEEYYPEGIDKLTKKPRIS